MHGNADSMDVGHWGLSRSLVINEWKMILEVHTDSKFASVLNMNPNEGQGDKIVGPRTEIKE